jgi:predicted small lipoprotein YifL
MLHMALIFPSTALCNRKGPTYFLNRATHSGNVDYGAARIAGEGKGE